MIDIRNTNERLLTLREAAEILNCSRSSIYAYAKAGDLETVRVGRQRGMRTTRSALNEFLGINQASCHHEPEDRYGLR